MLRRLHEEQPTFFSFTTKNKVWAEAQIKKYPQGREASAIIPLLWRAQEQEGWLSKPAIEYVADLLGMAHMRALEVATFYFMFHLKPVGRVAHFQICGTLSCMLCGAEDLIGVCKEKISPNPHELSSDGNFSWEEVECLGACSNAPMAQIGKDYFEDLSKDTFAQIIEDLAVEKLPTPGPQNGRFASEPINGLTSLMEYESGRTRFNGSVQMADDLKDTIKRIDGGETPLVTPWLEDTKKTAERLPTKKPKTFKAPKKAVSEDLSRLVGLGEKAKSALNRLGIFYISQLSSWSAGEINWVYSNLSGAVSLNRLKNFVEQARDTKN
jgi:NADH-quinone oxidoreductase subunit E|tara:strand:- start:15101 stop:16075 length:975 start_codon:yes stop_codon:yes gene_type:complete